MSRLNGRPVAEGGGVSLKQDHFSERLESGSSVVQEADGPVVCAWRQFGVQATGVNMEEVDARLVARFGPEAEGWLAEVPSLAARLAAQWGFVLGELFESGASSVVFRCQWRDGTPAVLKLSPDRALLTKQVEMLRVFAPSGRVPAVLSADAEAGAMVLEEVLPGTEAEDMPQTSLPQQWGELLAALHAVAPPAHWPLDLRGRCDEAFVRIGSTTVRAYHRRTDRPGRVAAGDTALRDVAGQSGQARVAARGSAPRQRPGRRPVARSDRDRPQGMHGRPVLRRRRLRGGLAAGQEGVEARCQRVATACGLDGDRLYAWSRVIAPMAAIAHLTYDGPEPVIDELLALSC